MKISEKLTGLLKAELQNQNNHLYARKHVLIVAAERLAETNGKIKAIQDLLDANLPEDSPLRKYTFSRTTMKQLLYDKPEGVTKDEMIKLCKDRTTYDKATPIRIRVHSDLAKMCRIKSIYHLDGRYYHAMYKDSMLGVLNG